MAALQALILFLWSTPGKSKRSAAWTLSGVIVRIAQRAEYHHDGVQLGLSPFEAELRRRIWSQIFVQDTTFAMVSGLVPSLMPVNWDIKEPPTPRDGPTEMAFCLVLHRLYKISSESVDIAGLDGIMLKQQGTKQATLAKFQLAVMELDFFIREIEERYVDPRAGNAHFAAMTLSPSLVKKLSVMVLNSSIEHADPSIFRTLLTTLEHTCELYEQMAACRFEWAMKLSFRYHLLATFV